MMKRDDFLKLKQARHSLEMLLVTKSFQADVKRELEEIMKSLNQIHTANAHLEKDTRE